MLWAEILDRVERFGDQEALSVENLSLTYSDLAKLVESISQSWNKTESKKVRRNLIRQRDSASVLIYILASWRCGIVPVVMRDNAPDTQLEELVSTLDPEQVLVNKIDLNSSYENTISPYTSPYFSARDEALVLSTSGSTGTPKLVALPAQSISINATVIGEKLNLSSEDRMVLNTPLTYMYGLLGGAMSGLWAGASLNLFSSRMPPSVVQGQMRKKKMTVFQSPPSMYQLFARYWSGEPFFDVRIVTTGGESLSAENANTIRQMFPNSERQFLYGMTEVGPRISHDDMDRDRYLKGGIGRPFSHIEWRIDQTNMDEAADQTGRLALRGPTLFLGYLDPTTGEYKGVDEEGWFLSSDLVSIDSDGEFYFKGRADRLFKTGGKLINPVAIEHVLSKHPKVRGARVWSHPHEILGLIPVADIVTYPGIQVQEAELVTLCETHLDSHMIPREITMRDDLPVASSGKLDLHAA